MDFPETARRRIGELRWSVWIARKNFEQFGGVPEPSPLLEMLGDQDFGEQRLIPVTKRSPATIKEEQAAAIRK